MLNLARAKINEAFHFSLLRLKTFFDPMEKGAKYQFMAFRGKKQMVRSSIFAQIFLQISRKLEAIASAWACEGAYV